MEATWTVPKNIRQIGEAHAHYAVYIEDYVSTYMKQVVRLSDGGVSQGALVGKIYPEDGKTIFVIQGVVTDKELYRSREQLFSATAKEAMREQCGQYFAELDMIGEVIFDSEEENIDAVRRDMFSEGAGAQKMLVHVDCMDGALKFYIGGQGALEVIESYYIFYDRNEAMQNYLIAYNEETRRKVEEVHDIISGQARAAMEENRTPRIRLQRDTLLICAACALLICISLLGIININQYQKMCEMQESFQYVLANIGIGYDDGSTIPVTSDAALQDDGVAQNDEATDGYTFLDITPEDGLTAGDDQNGLFDGLPIYDSDTAREDHTASGLEENDDGSNTTSTPDENGNQSNDIISGQHEEGDTAGQSGNENDAVSISGHTTGRDEGTSLSGQSAGADASGQGAGGAPAETVPGQGAEADALGQSAGGAPVETVPEQSAEGNASEQDGDGSNAMNASAQDRNEDSDLAQGNAVENETHREYTIKKGDTLTSISMLFYQNKNMIGQICALNGIEDADNIVAGQKILLP